MAKRRGKKIDKLVVRVEGRRHEFDVYLQKGEYSSEFIVLGEVMGVKVDVRDKDINALHDLVVKELTRDLAIAWKPKLRVSVLGRFDSFEVDDDIETVGDRANLEVYVEGYEVGVRRDGQKVYRDAGKDYNREGDIPEGDESDVGFGSDRQYGVAAVIDDTPENRQALIKIMAAMKQLHEGLSAFLKPGTIQKTLSDILTKGFHGLPALPPPAAAAAKATKARKR